MKTVPDPNPSEAVPPSRQAAQRKSDALELLGSQTTAWLATSSSRGGLHLVPLLFHFNGDVLTFATFLNSPTVANGAADSQARVAIGHPYDLVMIDGSITVVDPHRMDPIIAEAHASLLRGGPDPRQVPGLVYLQLTPVRLQTWRSFAELGGRTLMSSGRWLV